MRNQQKANSTNKTDTIGIWAASLILLAFFIAGQFIK